MKDSLKKFFRSAASSRLTPALLLAAVALLRWHNVSFFPVEERWDNYDIYYRSALKLLENPFSVSGRLPLYPYFLAFQIKFLVLSPAGLAAVNAGLNILTGLGVFLLLDRHFSRPAGLLFLLLWALDPRQAEASSVLMIENFYMFVNFLAVLSLALAFSARRYLPAAGFFAGLSFLTRSPVWGFYPFLAAACLLTGRRAWAAAAAKAALIGAAVFLLFPLSSPRAPGGGAFAVENPVYVNLYEAALGFDKSLSLSKAELKDLSPADLRRLAAERIKARPAAYAVSTLRRLARFFLKSFMLLGDFLPLYALLGIAAAAFAAYRLRGLEGPGPGFAFVSACFLLYYPLAHSPLSYMDRFTYVSDPYALFLVAAAAAKPARPGEASAGFPAGRALAAIAAAFACVLVFMAAEPRLARSYCERLRLSAPGCKETSDREVELILDGRKKEAAALAEESFGTCSGNLEFLANYAWLHPDGAEKARAGAAGVCSRCDVFLDLKDRGICGVFGIGTTGGSAKAAGAP